MLRQEGEQGAGFQDAGAQRVDQEIGAAAHRFGQARRADREFERSSSGSAKAASSRRHSTLIGRRPETVRTISRPSATVRSSPSSSMMPR